MLRVSGIQDGGWDPFIEAEEALIDFSKLLRKISKKGVSRESFHLGLLIYCHSIEMSAPYHILFISYSFKEENEKLVRMIKDFLEAYSIFIITGAKPSTNSVSEKVKKLIDDSDCALAVLTKDEEQKDKSWTPSKWVFDEIAYASGKRKTVI